MKYITFYRENNNFDDIIKDSQLKKLICTKITWTNYLLVGLEESKTTEQVLSIITLKYGDEIKTSLTKDYSPIANVDYVPDQDLTKWKQRFR